MCAGTLARAHMHGARTLLLLLLFSILSHLCL